MKKPGIVYLLGKNIVDTFDDDVDISSLRGYYIVANFDESIDGEIGIIDYIDDWGEIYLENQEVPVDFLDLQEVRKVLAKNYFPCAGLDARDELMAAAKKWSEEVKELIGEDIIDSMCVSVPNNKYLDKCSTIE